MSILYNSWGSTNLILQEDLEIYSGIMFIGTLSHEMGPSIQNLDSVGLQHSTSASLFTEVP